MAPKSSTVEQVVARIARGAHGVVTRKQLLRAGISSEEIKHRQRLGALIRVHRGVYRVGHAAPNVYADYLAAVRACGDRALLCCLAAAYLHRLIKGKPPPPELMAPTWRRVPGVSTRRVSPIHRGDATLVNGIPVTSVPRTLVDLAAILSLDDLARACHEAGVLYKTTPRQVDAVLNRRPNSPGAGNLRAVMRGEAHVTLSKLERAFLNLLRENGLPLPRTNRRAGARRVDCRWPDHALTVELDSYRFHNSRYSWEQGYSREREARTRDDEYRRFSYTDVTDYPDYVVRELRRLIA